MRLTHRRTVLITAGAVAVAAVTAGPSAAQVADIRGEVTFTGGAKIPEGQVEVYLEDIAASDKALRRPAAMRVESDGGATSIAFSLLPPDHVNAASTLRIVARLERADGWLLARGSSPVTAGAPVTVRLSTVMY